MDDKFKLAGVLLCGYLLGRTKRMKAALMVAGAVAANRSAGGSGLLGGAGGKLRDSVLSSPEIERLRVEVAGKLVDAGKAAALTAATKRIDSLSATLQDQTERLRDAQSQVAPQSGEAAESDEPEGEEPPEAEAEGKEAAESQEEPAAEKEPESEEEAEPEEPAAPPARSRGTRQGAGKTGSGSKPAAKSGRSSASKPAGKSGRSSASKPAAKSGRSSASKPAATRRRRTSSTSEPS